MFTQTTIAGPDVRLIIRARDPQSDDPNALAARVPLWQIMTNCGEHSRWFCRFQTTAKYVERQVNCGWVGTYFFPDGSGLTATTSGAVRLIFAALRFVFYIVDGEAG